MLPQRSLASGAVARPRLSTSRLLLLYNPISPRVAISHGISHHNRTAFSTSSPSQKSLYASLKNRWKHASPEARWSPLAVPLGILIGLGAFSFGYNGYQRYVKFSETQKRLEEREGSLDANDLDRKSTVRPTGPWQVRFMAGLPLKGLSRLWGKFNEIPLPTFLRPAGFKLYAYIFGANIGEAKNQDLYSYRNLAEFFYREIDPAARPIDATSAVVSPSDGKVLMLGEVREGGRVENVKGMTYSLDALLSGHGEPKTSHNPASPAILFSKQDEKEGTTETTATGGEVVHRDEEFARMNGISYTVGELFSGVEHTSDPQNNLDDQSIQEKKDVGDIEAVVGTKTASWFRKQLEGPKRLYFAVIYLAPGDYHRFHSPTEWVVETRRHFAGELFSVSPYLQAILPSLFILNERVVLLGRWKHGFFSMTPVGATNVGSIVLNFDRELRTNSLTKDTKADSLEGHGYVEAHYQLASKLLGGHPLRRGEEMGGFRLGSTIVLVFEAPEGKDGKGFKWIVEKGKTVKMGEALGVVE
ncbi:hypothetical protein ABW19_dt0209587 [Dactylella cylindrospora]|nr:hypothetical protein ABW19_dt0209587 [Dactylella cylindrospora]